MKRFRKAFSVFLKPLLLLFLLIGYCPLSAEEADISETLFHHVQNSGELELFPFLPAIHLPEGITVHQFMLVLSSLLILILFIFALKKRALKPGKFLIGIESLLLFIRDDVVYPVMGEKKGSKWMPFFTTLFIYLVVINLLGLIPAFKTATGNINVTAALAVIVFLLTFAVGFKEAGFFHFFKKPGPPGSAIAYRDICGLSGTAQYFYQIDCFEPPAFCKYVCRSPGYTRISGSDICDQSFFQFCISAVCCFYLRSGSADSLPSGLCFYAAQLHFYRYGKFTLRC